MNILHISAEMSPWAQTGGLGEVLAGLPLAQARLGHDVAVLLPRYGGIAWPKEAGDPWSGHVSIGDQKYEFRVSEQVVGSFPVRVFLLDHPWFSHRTGMYGDAGVEYQDQGARFAFFQWAAVEFLRSFPGGTPDVVHAHDWSTGLIPHALKTNFRIGRPRSIFTIHNLSFLGLFPLSEASSFGMDATHLNPDRFEFYGKLSFLKAGILDADAITTVSRQYAREIQTPEHGFGLDGCLRQRAGDLVGIVNGIDTERWNPATDPWLPARFDAETFSVGKALCKEQLQALLGFSVEARRPLCTLIGRLTHQKGIDVLLDWIHSDVGAQVQCVVMGKGDPAFEHAWSLLAREAPRRVAYFLEYNEEIAHLLYGAADLFWMPSRFEPCGMGQQYAQRYGAIPVGYATGGLVDTVDPYDRLLGRGTGFLFYQHNTNAFFEAMNQALDVFSLDPAAWQGLVRRAMQRDCSWAEAAVRLAKLYG